MPNVITTLRPSTELQAVNVMLGAIGEAPLDAGSNLTTLSTDNATIHAAVEILTESVREVLTAGWRFNTLTGFEIAPDAVYDWEDTEGVTTELNVFKAPTWVLAFKQTKCTKMAGVEIIETPSLAYTEGDPPASVMVLFDRVKNRDGLESSRYPFVYLDVIRAVDFTQMPESARRYATIMASRRFAQRLPSSDLQAAFTQQDESQSLRVLKREQGLNQTVNFLDTVDGYNQRGQRPDRGGGFFTRVYPGGI